MHTLEKIQILANDLYNNKYKYHEIIKTQKNPQLKIECPMHGIFLKYIYDHIKRNQGCPNCSKPAKLSNEKFIQKANIIHSNKYDYSEVQYKNNNTKVKILCKTHGVFFQTPHNHLAGQNCPNCRKNIKLSQEEFIKRANIIHNNKYDYTNTNFKILMDKVKIMCLTHGEFSQTANDHLSGNGCYKCVGLIRTTKDFIEKANKIHNNLYDYSKVEYKKSHNKITIICKIHGEFKQSPNAHISGSGCNKCSVKNYSKLCLKWLDKITKDENIYIQHAGNIGEYRTKINNKLYKFDGYCQQTNTVYEFYGSLWHGDIKIYNSEDFNPVNKKQFGKLYNETKKREDVIIKNGFKLVTMWESDYLKQ